jgi:hypothetical protein
MMSPLPASNVTSASVIGMLPLRDNHEVYGIAMRALLAFALLAGCGGESRTPAIANVGGTRPKAVPAGWVAIEPDDERLRCANHADDEWQVAIQDGVVTFTEAKEREADTGPPLRFTPKHQLPTRPRQHVLAVSDGFLVGLDGGEWGGALYWYAADGATSVKLADENVRGLVAIGPDLVASIEGLSHIVSSEGNVRWIERAGTWRVAGAPTALDAAPSTFAATQDVIYVVTTASLVRVTHADRKAKVIQPMRTSSLYPDSMASDDDGTLWIGMRQFVLRLVPNGDQFTPTWFVRATCLKARARDLTCVCAPG